MSQFLSCKILNNNIDLFTLLRMDLDMLFMAPIVMKKLFIKVMLMTFAVFCVILVKVLSDDKRKAFFAYCKRCILSFIKQCKEGKLTKKSSVVVIVLLLLPVFCTNTIQSISKITSEAKSYLTYAFLGKDELFKMLGTDKQYTNYQDVKATKGKNVVIIYCESLENGYFDKSLFADLTPNLDRMKENGFVSYDNYQNIFGAGWTIGALYATQTSFPCLFGHNDGNDIFNKIKDIQVVSYANVMKKAGYNNLFLSSANFEFAGTGNMMHMLGYDLKKYDQYDVKMRKTGWGIQDADLFAQAKLEYHKMANSGQPFNLTLLTVDTHFTNGIPDKRLKDKITIDIDKHPMEYCVASLDYLIEDFYNYMKEQPGFDNTVLIILGDHPVMGSAEQTPVVKLLNTKERRITLISNSLPQRFRPNDKIGYYDIPNFILEATGVKHNAVFLDDMINGDVEANVKKNAALYTHLNLKLNQ